MEFRILASLALRLVVFEQHEGLLREQGYGDEVADGHESHEQIDDAECLLKRHERASQHHATSQQSEHKYRLGLLGDEADVGFAIEVIADDRAVGKEEDGSRDEISSNRANLSFERLCGEHNAVSIAIVIANVSIAIMYLRTFLMVIPF